MNDHRKDKLMRMAGNIAPNIVEQHQIFTYQPSDPRFLSLSNLIAQQCVAIAKEIINVIDEEDEGE